MSTDTGTGTGTMDGCVAPSKRALRPAKKKKLELWWRLDTHWPGARWWTGPLPLTGAVMMEIVLWVFKKEKRRRDETMRKEKEMKEI